jgi:tetratricopeptide (TPR) repeat protein
LGKKSQLPNDSHLKEQAAIFITVKNAQKNLAFLLTIFCVAGPLYAQPKAQDAGANADLISGQAVINKQLEASGVLQSKPQNAQEFLKRGIAKYEFNDFTGALNDLDKSIQMNPNIGEAYLYRGKCLKALKDPQSALQDFNKALQLNPGSAKYYQQSGERKEAAQHYAEAIEDYNKALELKPEAGTYLARGDAKIKMGNYQSALIDFNQAVQLEPSNPQAYLKRAYAEYKLKNYRSSMQDHETAKELYSQQGDLAGYQTAVRSINLLREINTKPKKANLRFKAF